MKEKGLCAFCKPRLYDLSKLGWRKQDDLKSVQNYPSIEPEWFIDDDGKPRMKSRKIPDAIPYQYRNCSDNESPVKVEIDGKKSSVSIEYARTDTLPDCPEICAAADAGCALCAMLLKMIKEDYTGLAYESGTQLLFNSIDFQFVPTAGSNIKSPNENHNFLLEAFVVRKARPSNSGDHFHFLVATCDDLLTASMLNIARRPTQSDVTHPQNLALIRSWISDCHEHPEHKLCGSQNDPELPTRVIDVRDLEKAGVAKLYIAHGQRDKYVALSYCWPRPTATSKPPLKTKAANLGQMQTSIPMSELTGSQQTCLRLAAKLGFKYVWIDALCIIQDSESDWRAESAKMGDIYKDAALTVIPDAALSDPSRRQTDEQWYDIPWSYGQDGRLTGSYILGTAGLEANGMWWGDEYGAKSAPLVVNLPGADNRSWICRAWTLQEDLLSRRKLYLGNTRMQFVCLRSKAAEDTLWLRKGCSFEKYTRSQSIFTSEDTRDLPDPWQRQHKPKPQSFNQTRQIYDHWYRTIDMYSTRLLTYPSDTLIAIGGLAERLASLLKAVDPNQGTDNYVGGIWEHDLLRGLLWVDDEIESQRANYLPCYDRLPKDFEGASWLWSSIQLRKKIESSTILHKDYRCRFMLECQDAPACNYITASQCRIMNRIAEPRLGSVYTSSRVYGDLEVIGRLIELECNWEFQVSPAEGYQTLQLPAPLKELQGFDIDDDLDPYGSGGIILRLEHTVPAVSSATRSDKRDGSLTYACQWTQQLHDLVSCGKLRVFAILMVYGIVRNHIHHFQDRISYKNSTMGLLLVAVHPEEAQPKLFRRFGMFHYPGEDVEVDANGDIIDVEKSRPHMHDAFHLAQTRTIVVF